jgi:SAM-dependent methyltransferase
MAWDPIWEKIFSDREWGKYPPEDLIRFVARNFYKAENRQDVRILEVGSGPGANLWYIAREGFSTYGVEGSATAVAHARERLDHECPGWQGDVLTGDIVDLPFEDGFFDAVIDNEAVTHNPFEDSKAIFKEMARVSKPEGKLFSRTFATGCWGDKTGEYMGHNAWIVAEGPLDLGEYTRFTDYEEIRDLISPFATTEVELLTRTMADGKHEIKEWLINAELP